MNITKIVPKENLYCSIVFTYPAHFEDLNFPKMIKLKNLSDVIGYSGHHQTIDDAILAISMGAKFIEKHFTIDNSLPGIMNLLFCRQNLLN